MAAGRPFPPWDNRPQLRQDLRWIYEAFWELQTCRPVGMGGAGPIPWTAINEWAEANGVRGRKAFELIIRRVDAAVLAHHRKRIAKEK